MVAKISDLDGFERLLAYMEHLLPATTKDTLLKDLTLAQLNFIGLWFLEFQGKVIDGEILSVVAIRSMVEDIRHKGLSFF